MKKNYFCYNKETIVKIAGKRNNPNHFNSKQHMLKTWSAYMGRSLARCTSIYERLSSEGLIKLEDGILKLSDEFLKDLCTAVPPIPQYILKTCKLKEESYRLHEEEWAVMNVILNLTKYIGSHVYKGDSVYQESLETSPDFNFTEEQERHYFEEKTENEANLGYKEQYFFSAATIAKHTDLTITVVRSAMHKLRLYFGENFWRKQNLFEKLSRKYRSRALTINMPQKSVWQCMIEIKTKELNGGEDIVLDLPRIVKEDELDEFNKINENIQKENVIKKERIRKGEIEFEVAKKNMILTAFSEILKKRKVQVEKMQESRVIIQEQKELWRQYRDAIFDVFTEIEDGDTYMIIQLNYLIRESKLRDNEDLQYLQELFKDVVDIFDPKLTQSQRDLYYREKDC